MGSKIILEVISFLVIICLFFGFMIADGKFWAKGYVTFDHFYSGKPVIEKLTLYKGPDLVRDKLTTITIDKNTILPVTRGYIGKCYFYANKDMLYIDGLNWVVKDQIYFNPIDKALIEDTLDKHWDRIKNSNPDNYKAPFFTIGSIIVLFWKLKKYLQKLGRKFKIIL